MSRLTPRRVLWGLLVAGASCTRPTPVIVTTLSVDDFEGGGVIGMTSAQLEQRMRARLEAARFVLLKEGERPAPEVQGWNLRLAAGLEEPDAETEQGARVSVVLHLRQQGAAEGFEVRSAIPSRRVSNDVKAVQAAAREALDAGLGRVVREARAIIELGPAKDGALAAHLKDSDEATRDAAVRLLVARRSLAALPPLLAQLKNPDLDVVRRAVGLLVELKAQQAVNPMIEATGRQGSVVEREIVFAVGAIGGDDAEAYLDLVATGHDDPVVRASAEAALRELRARRDGQGASK